eukprot:SAG31_NODE_3197_length_4567_cov_2.365040_5_plen_132_part_00
MCRWSQQRCRRLPQICNIISRTPELFRRVRLSDTDDISWRGVTNSWEGVHGDIKLIHIRPWTRLKPDARATGNDRWTVLLPLNLAVTAREPRPWITVGDTRQFLGEGEVTVYDDSYVTEFFNPSNNSRQVA